MKNQPAVFYIFIIVFVGSSIFFALPNIARSDDSISTTIKISICGNDIKEGGENCDGDDLGDLECENFDFNNGALGCDDSCVYDMSNCSTDAEVSISVSFNAETGGTYTLDDNDNQNSLKITLPANFHTKNHQVQMFVYNNIHFNDSKPVFTNKNFIGKTYDVVIINPGGNIVPVINKPATIVLTYTASDVAGMDEATIAPYHWSTDDTSWQLILNSIVNTADKTITFSTSHFSSFVLLASSSSETDTDSPSPIVSAGGLVLLSGVVNFSGKTYEQSNVTLLKDGQVLANLTSGPNGNFYVSVPNITPGNYIFSLYSEDKTGMRSPLVAFPLQVIAGQVANRQDIFIFEPLFKPALQVDLNGDDRINLADFLILAYRFNNPSSSIKVDLNGDGLFNLTDVSILVYYWTG